VSSSEDRRQARQRERDTFLSERRRERIEKEAEWVAIDTIGCFEDGRELTDDEYFRVTCVLMMEYGFGDEIADAIIAKEIVTIEMWVKALRRMQETGYWHKPFMTTKNHRPRWCLMRIEDIIEQHAGSQ